MAPRTAGGASTAPSATTAPAVGTAPGAYTYDSSGTFTVGTNTMKQDGTSTLTVDKPVGSTQHSALSSDDADTSETAVYRSTGSYLTDLTLTSQAYTKEFVSKAGVLFVPSDLTIGKTWSWSLASTDGKATAKQTSKVTKTESVLVGGRSVPTTVIETTLTVTGDVDLTDEMTTDYAVAYRLPVKTHDKISGTYEGFMFKGDATATLRSTSAS